MKKVFIQILCLTATALLAFAAYGQQMAADSTTSIKQDTTVTKRVIRGEVHDNLGPLFGAVVYSYSIEDRTIVGITTKAKGEFELTLPKQERKLSHYKYLTASYMGYDSYVVALDTLKTDSLRIVLFETDPQEALNEPLPPNKKNKRKSKR